MCYFYLFVIVRYVDIRKNHEYAQDSVSHIYLFKQGRIYNNFFVEFEQVEYDLKVTGSFYFDVEEDKGDYYTAPSCEVGNLEVYINSIDVKKGEEQEALFNTPFHNNDKQIKNWLETYCFG